MNRLKMLDLFSGIGGFSLAASWTGAIETVAFCEIEPYCQKVLQKNFPGILIHSDITKLRGEDVGAVDIVCGGFPCQPFSNAGKRRGKEDDRYLWPELLRVIAETHPLWVIGENVTSLLNLGIEEMLLDLEDIGYRGGVFQIPASAISATFAGDRIYIVATSHSKQCYCLGENIKIKPTAQYQKMLRAWKSESGSLPLDLEGFFADTGQRIERNDDGLSEGLDRLKCIGNAVVPQVVYPILQGIVEIERRDA
ncbi:MAG TPA: DNA (cytosine-5-)-methyltransferase [Pelotomaculum sp.]|jgi:DNA (cytosine-5)-methyltransferase 1|nr:DNA (cytosine-5-)-methyltransferase [Pelotomaculum sp.]